MSESPPLPPPEPSQPWDLPLYLVGGFGLYLVASLAYGAAFVRDPNDLPLNIVVGLFALNLACLGGMTLVLGVWRKRLTLAELGVWPVRWEWRYLFWAAGLAVAFMPIRMVLALGAQWLLEGSFDSLQMRENLFSAGQNSVGEAAVMLLWAGLLVPLSEELYFRGLLLRWFQPRLGLWPRVLVVALLFALAHFDNVGSMVSTFFLGVFCAYAVERTRSIWFAVAIHAVNNSLALGLLYGLLWLSTWLKTFAP